MQCRDQGECAGAGAAHPKRLDVDPQLQLELSVCAEYRIPHSEFLRWPQDDRDKAIWYHIRERQRCQACKTRPDEWDESKGGYRWAYMAEERRCRGCEVLEAGRAAQAADQGRGVHVVLARNADREGVPG